MNVTKQRELHRQWYQKNKDRMRPYKAANMRKYRAANPEKYREQSRANKRKQRERLLEMYGAICAICGFDDVRALTLDHILRNGEYERTTLGERGVYRRALETHRPQEYRTLCMNCQFISRSSG